MKTFMLPDKETLCKTVVLLIYMAKNALLTEYYLSQLKNFADSMRFTVHTHSKLSATPYLHSLGRKHTKSEMVFHVRICYILYVSLSLQTLKCLAHHNFFTIINDNCNPSFLSIWHQLFITTLKLQKSM